MSKGGTSTYPQAMTIPASAVPSPEFIPEAVAVPSSDVSSTEFAAMSPQELSIASIQPNVQATKEFLSSMHWPVGFQTFLLKNVHLLPYRFFICDDSGSMSSSDGKRLVGTGNNSKVVGCTRWTELVETMKFHSTLAHIMNVPIEFRMLNSASPIHIGGPLGSPDNLPLLHAVLDQSPGGGTPLCRHILEVTAEIRRLAPQLQANGRKAVIMIATDGEASDGNLAEAMKALQSLPVWVIVRLCTDQENVVNYWNKIDEDLELNLDILDDLVGESEEVARVNPWLNYCEPLHRLREFGLRSLELDLLDERRLTPDEARALCTALFGQPPTALPHPETEFPSFCQHVLALATHPDSPMQYSVAKRKVVPLIDEAKLRETYEHRQTGGCTVS